LYELNLIQGVIINSREKTHNTDIVKRLGVLNINYLDFKKIKDLEYWEELLNLARVLKSKDLSTSFKNKVNYHGPKIINPIVLLKLILAKFRAQKFRNIFYASKTVYRKNRFYVQLYFLCRFSILHNFMVTLKLKDKNIKAKFQNIDLKRLIVCHQGPHPETHALLRVCKSLKVESIFFQHNWDNISSKEVLYYFPDYFLVWNYQCLLHATSVWGIDSDRVVVAGNYRLDNHLESLRFLEKPLKKRKRLLFLGDSTGFDEKSVLLTISKVFDNWGAEWEILYRPHPYLRKSRFSANELPSNLKIADDLADDYFNFFLDEHIIFSKNVASLNSERFVKLVKESHYVVCGGSTITLEVLTIGRPILLLTSDYGILSTLDLTHLVPLKSLKGVVTINVESLNELKLEESLKLLENEKIDSKKLNYLYNVNAVLFEKTIINILSK
jgi:hypothetical protein